MRTIALGGRAPCRATAEPPAHFIPAIDMERIRMSSLSVLAGPAFRHVHSPM
jgi:hypothetical protein